MPFPKPSTILSICMYGRGGTFTCSALTLPGHMKTERTKKSLIYYSNNNVDKNKTKNLRI